MASRLRVNMYNRILKWVLIFRMVSKWEDGFLLIWSILIIFGDVTKTSNLESILLWVGNKSGIFLKRKMVQAEKSASVL